MSTKKALIKDNTSFPSLPSIRNSDYTPLVLWKYYISTTNLFTPRRDERNALTILWRIENISCFQKEYHGKEILSPYFYPHSLQENWTQLYLVPRGNRAADIYVRLRLSTGSPFPVNCEFSFDTWDGSPLVTSEGRFCDTSPFPSFEMTGCPTQEELFTTKKCTFLPHDTLTVRCRVWKSKGNFPHAEFISIRSQIQLAEGSILWPIANFNQNETFPIELQFMHGSVVFDLECSLTGDSLQNSELYVVIPTRKKLGEYRVKLEVSISDNTQEVLKLGDKEHSFPPPKQRNIRALPKLELRENLKEKISLLKCGDNLCFSFRLTAVCKSVSNCIEKASITTSDLEQDSAGITSAYSEASCQTSKESSDSLELLRSISLSEAKCQTLQKSGVTLLDSQQRNDCLGILGENFFSLYQDQTFSDFELRSGDVSFPVHKNILCARSPVFNSMFSIEMMESKSNFLDIPDIDTQTLNQMLTFLYGGTMEPNLPLNSAVKLYYAADKYQVDSLKYLCSSVLKSQISISNTSEILVLADRHRDSDLTSFVHNFILNHFDDVMDSKEWEKFLDINPALAGKSAHLLYKEKRERKKKVPKKGELVLNT